MEFDKPSTKYMFIGIMIAALLGMGYLFSMMIRLDMAREAEQKLEMKACDELPLKFLDAVKVKESKFYQDQVFYIVRKSQFSVELQFPFKSHENIKVRCSDVEKTEDPYAGMVIIGQ